MAFSFGFSSSSPTLIYYGDFIWTVRMLEGQEASLIAWTVLMLKASLIVWKVLMSKASNQWQVIAVGPSLRIAMTHVRGINGKYN